MGLLDLLNHFLNFAAPAFAVAVVMPLFARVVGGKAVRRLFVLQAAFNFLAGLAMLLAGMWLWDRDGKMASYIAMVLACATSQWVMQSAWRD